MKNFQLLGAFVIYLNFSKIRLLIQIVPCRICRIQKGSIKEQPFLRRGGNKLYSSHREKKEGSIMWNACVPWVFVLPHAFICKLKITTYRGSSEIPPSFKMELLCQYELTFRHYIVTKNSITDDMEVRDPPLVGLFSVQNITK